MNAPPFTASCEFGLSDFSLIDNKRPYGPTLRFTTTWYVELPTGAVWAQSIRGWRYGRVSDGKFVLWPPISRRGTQVNYYAAVNSSDLQLEITRRLEEAGWKERVGTNYDPATILDLPVSLG